MGSLSGRDWSDLARIWPWLVIGVVGVWVLARPLDALAAGAETARGLGLRVPLATALIVALACLTTAAAVAAGGIIGFVGLIAPHVARRLVGETHGWLIPRRHCSANPAGSRRHGSTNAHGPGQCRSAS
jgi:iron complex transport system permease protein